MRSNLENNLARQLHLYAPTHDVVDVTLTGSFSIPADGPSFLFIDGGLATRTVFLPEIPPQGGLEFVISNEGVTNSLIVVDANGVTIVTLAFGQLAVVVSSRTAWNSLISLTAPQSDLIAGLLQEPRVVTGDFVVALSDVTIAIQKVAPVATAGTLPSIASRVGKPVSILDFSTGFVGDHTITLTPNGADTIMQQATWTLVSNTANLASITLWPSATLNTWYVKP